MSLDNLLKDQIKKVDELKMASVFIGYKGSLKEELSQAKLEVNSIMTGIEGMKHDLEIMKAQNVKCRNLSVLLEKLDAKFVKIEEHLSAEFLQEFTRLNEEASPYVAQSNKENCKPLEENQLVGQTKNLSLETPELRIKDCKKTLFTNAEDSYSMELLNEDEFAKIPKYMIGRQTLVALNDLVTTINQILETKYSLLALGKNGARKKGKLDLYLSLKRDEIVVAPGEDPIYFFTAMDYQRHTQSRLDKTKLNLITALRHCKRLRELRVGKTLQYVVIPAWESSKGGIYG